MTSTHSLNKEGIEGKYCIGINRNKHWCPLIDFVKDSSRNDRLSNKCKLYTKEYIKINWIQGKRDSDKRYQQSDKEKIKAEPKTKGKRTITISLGKKREKQARRIRDDLKINGCAICGYNKCKDALVFHHVNPEDKCFPLDVTYMMMSDEKLVDEINKCIVICANCHREIHSRERNRENGFNI